MPSWLCLSSLGELPAGVGVGDAAVRQVAANPHLDGVPAGGGQIEANFRVPLTAEQLAAKPTMETVVYSQADWAKKPTAAQMAAIYPVRAAEAGVGGTVNLAGAVSATGAVSGCRIARESPICLGFAEAALKGRPLFPNAPKQVSGIAVVGTVTIPIRFIPPPPGPPDLNIRCVAQIC